MHSQNTDKPKIAQGIRFTTRHAFLVLAGTMANALGLRRVLESGLRIKQKVYSHTPVDKVLQALVGILGGNRYMKDLNCAASPVAKDESVARAWGARTFAHFSTVCRTLRTFTAEDAQTLANLLGTITRARLQRLVDGLAGPDGHGLIFVDVDLTGQKVRGETTQYTGTAFGYIQGQLARGYQIAAAFLHTGARRFAIAGRLKPANVRPGPCLLELVSSIEAVLGRPRRRVEYVQQGIEALTLRITQWQTDLAALGQGSGVHRRRKALERQLQEALQTLAALQTRLQTYLQENAGNPTPRRIVLRADSAFGTTEVIERCLELGYELVLKRYSVTPYRKIFESAPEAAWTNTGKKRLASESLPIPTMPLLVPFPLRQVAMQRLDVDGKIVRSILVTTLPADEFPLLPLIRLYEARQSIEAAFQECKHTFHFGSPRLRSEEANAAYTQLVLFAFNLVRWTECVMTKGKRIIQAGTRLWVRVAANCRATVWLTAVRCTLRFSPQSGLSGVDLTMDIPSPGSEAPSPSSNVGLFAPLLS